MRIERFTDLHRMYELVEPLLMQNEAENNFMLGHIAGLAKEPANPDHFFGVVIDDNQTIEAVATRTPPWPMSITRGSDAAMDTLAEWVHANLPRLEEIAGPVESSMRCANTLAQLTGRSVQTRSMMRIFQLTKLIPPQACPGSMRAADESDLDRIVEWMDAFGVEIGEPHQIPRERLLQRLQKRHFHFWMNPDPVSVGGWTGRTPNGVRINAVYTPPEHRGRGYASNLVAALTKKMLVEGRKFCFLYTDAANPTSNKIYQQIGYEFVCDSVKLELV
jgi:predicted GNAT family acetyltransferase